MQYIYRVNKDVFGKFFAEFWNDETQEWKRASFSYKTLGSLNAHFGKRNGIKFDNQDIAKEGE